MVQSVEILLEDYKREMQAELDEILSYWTKNTCDNINGGFIGRIDEHNISDTAAAKGSVLNSRILWAYSSAFTLTGNQEYLHLATIAFNYITSTFIDKKHGGVYWSVTAAAKPLDTKKQIYALAFAMYGCCAYYTASKNETAKNTAIELFNTIEQQSFDQQYSGYFEAFTRDWKPMSDLRLSAKDANEKKTMNTHLHVLEAYAALYHIWPDKLLKQKIVSLLENFIHHITDSSNYHLILFLDEQWNPKSSTISYGHDIEAAWLILEAAETIQEPALIAIAKDIAVKMADAAAEGLDNDGGMWYEREPSENHLVKEKHSWVQAEAMVGFFNCWQIKGNETYLHKSLGAWKYVQDYIKDKQYGEWLWGMNEDGKAMPGQDKAGLWKCPYHNSRACLEIINRIEYLGKEKQIEKEYFEQ